MHNKDLIIIGAGGHAKVVLDCACNSGWNVVGAIDKIAKEGLKKFNIPILGNDDILEEVYRSGVKYAIIGIGHIGNYKIRNSLFDRLKEIGYILPNIIHNSAVISNYATMGEGNVVFPGAVVNSGATLGNNCIINTGSVIEHDADIRSNVHIAPKSVILGASKIDNDTFVGSNSVVLQEKSVGKRVIIGANSTVLKDIEDDSIVVGTPARTIRRNK